MMMSREVVSNVIDRYGEDLNRFELNRRRRKEKAMAGESGEKDGKSLGCLVAAACSPS